MKKYLLLIIVGGLFFGCGSDDNHKAPKDIQVHDFVWKGLNSYYLWKDDVQNLADNRFNSQEEKYSFFRGYSDPEDLFEKLLFRRGEIDRFSLIYEDYDILEQVLSGTEDSNGVDYQLFLKPGTSDKVIGWVRYILPDSDASNKNIKRGDLFYAVNGTELNTQNYRSLLSQDNYVLNLVTYNNGIFTPNGQSVGLTKQKYAENPVYYYNVYNIGSHKIGYLIYNGFYGDYDVELNNAFGYFKAQGITDFVLDLRYNSGGLISSATHLASMITGQFNNEIFGKQQWNSQINDFYVSRGEEEELINRFTDKLKNGQPINHLYLNKICILTTSSTASASELVINGLAPYINVVQIGDTTVGKNVGSVTLYDSPSFAKNKLNPNHKYVMQPLVLKIVNRDGFGEYQSGLAPDILITETLNTIKPLGDITEPFLASAISYITTYAKPIIVPSAAEVLFQPINHTKGLNPLKSEMYLDEFPPLTK